MARPFNRQGWLISQLRRLSIKYPPRLKVLNEGKIVRYIKSKLGKDLKRCFHNCKVCGKEYPQSKIQMDHEVPVGEFKDIGTFVDRLFCPEENWRKLCIDCHLAKSSSEIREKYFKKQQKKLTKKKK